MTTPIPAQIASTDSVTFEGGNMAGSYAVDGTNLVVTFTGPQTSSALQFPRVVVHQTIADAPSGTPIEWKVWSSLRDRHQLRPGRVHPEGPDRQPQHHGDLGRESGLDLDDGSRRR